jgi:hypothetical protein
MVMTFQIPAGGVNAFYDNGNRHIEIAGSARFSTTSKKLIRFLATYPGVTLLEKREEVIERSAASQFGPRPQQVTVINGGLSGGGAMNAKQKSEKAGDIAKG